MKLLATDRLPDFFDALAVKYEVRLPVLLADGTRALGQPGDGPLAFHGGALPAKPTGAFFPHQEPVFTAANGDFRAPSPGRPLLVAGFTSRDLACLRFVDRFFTDSPPDDLYVRWRQGSVVVGVSGWCGAGGCLLPLADGGCDLEMIWDGSDWLVATYSGVGTKLTAGLPDAAATDTMERLRRESAQLTAEDMLIRGASEIVRAGRVPDTFWEEIGDRCIACTGCNLVCPTCTCFGVQDWRYGKGVERSRMWDSCQLEGFMREASGHNPLGSEALRTRRRIHHKLAADPDRWGEISCFVCGRCDAACPTGIGIFAVAREILARFG